MPAYSISTLRGKVCLVLRAVGKTLGQFQLFLHSSHDANHGTYLFFFSVNKNSKNGSSNKNVAINLKFQNRAGNSSE